MTDLKKFIAEFPFKPILDGILIYPDVEEKIEQPSLITRDLKSDKVSTTPKIIYEKPWQFSTVVAVGQGRRYVDSGVVGYMPMSVKPGDRVCTARNNTEFEYDGVKMEMINEGEIRLIVS